MACRSTGPPEPVHALQTDLNDRLADRHFAGIAEVIETRVGIKLPPGKRTMVEGRLRKRVRALGLTGLGAYGAQLFDKGGLDGELVHLIDCVTTNKTDFFREPSHFEFLRDVAVPELARRQSPRPLSLKVWSAASSSGAEAYTAAMVLQDMINAGKHLRFSILGTDISTEMLEQARKAVYPCDFVVPVPAPMLSHAIAGSAQGRRARLAGTTPAGAFRTPEPDGRELPLRPRRRRDLLP
jgi:chemotaxis protein methyltransferase CheR